MSVWAYMGRVMVLGCVGALMAACAAPSTKTYVCRQLTPQQYCVQPGDSLSRIAQRFQIHVAQIKQWNHLSSDVIHPGQALTVRTALPVLKPASANTATRSSSGFVLHWPVRGTVIVPYGANNKGIDIASTRGTLVTAAADGVVIYVGNDVKGYGNLLLIRHNDSVITAYANNESLLVADKAKVQAGQIIAAVGDSGRNDGQTALHFEVRVNSKHVDPMLYLK